MHIVYHHRTLADGAEGIHIREMIQAFRQLGHRVTVLGAVGEGGPRAARASSVRAHFPQGLFEMGALAYSALDYVTIARLLRVQRADLVYKRHALLDVGVALAAKHAGIPLVLEVNTAYASAMLQSFEPLSFPSLAARAERTAFRNATVVATVSSPLAEYVTQAAPSAGMVMVVPNGADPQKFRRREGLGDQLRSALGWEGHVIVGWAGVLREWHRLDLLLDAVCGIPAVRLLLIGDGPEQARIERRARELQIADRVHITGRIAHDRMPEYLAALDVAVAADDRTGYASPMKVLEYMAMELAVVAPRLRNIEDVVDHGQDAMLFEPGSAESLRQTLVQLVNDRDMRRRLGRAARQTIETKRTWTRNAELILEAVQRNR